MSFIEAFKVAQDAHLDQNRKDFPAHFITHPLAVAAIVMEYGEFDADSDTVAAALLHDVVEDSPVSNAELNDQFGAYVAGLVGVVTHRPGLKGKEKRDAYIVSVAETKMLAAVLISAADKLDNLRSVLHGQFIGKAQDYEHGMWFYERLFEVYKQRLPGVPALLSEFESTLNRVKANYAQRNADKAKLDYLEQVVGE